MMTALLDPARAPGAKAAPVVVAGNPAPAEENPATPVRA
jgi:hypothetical protein